MLYVGIDNGLSGGIVGINEHQKVAFKYIMPTIKSSGKTEYNVQEIDNIFKCHLMDICNVKVVLEKAHTRPVQGIRSAFTTGFGFGLMQGLLESNKISYEIVSPQEWMKELGINSKDEKGSIKYCQRMFPQEDFRATDRCKIQHDGLTDATCIALVGFRRNNNVK